MNEKRVKAIIEKAFKKRLGQRTSKITPALPPATSVEEIMSLDNIKEYELNGMTCQPNIFMRVYYRVRDLYRKYKFKVPESIVPKTRNKYEELAESWDLMVDEVNKELAEQKRQEAAKE